MTIFPVPRPRPKVKPPKGMKAVNRARQASEFARTMGSRARQKFVTLGPCAACGTLELCDNAHVLGNDGAGRKREYRSIAPLCRPRYEGREVYEGCHRLSHRDPEEFRRRYPNFNATKAARLTEKRFQSFLRSSSQHTEETSND